MRVDEFDFELPEDLIALRPAQPRDASRLLHVGAELIDRQFSEITSLIAPGDALVLNNTKVIPAALKGVRPARDAAGADVTIELNLHKALPLSAEGEVCWRAFARPAKRLAVGDEVHFADRLKAIVTDRQGAEVALRFNVNQETFDRVLERAGSVPLPPYIGRKRGVDDRDKSDYQTVFARLAGSVAAPTAGLHFTPDILTTLKDKGVLIEQVTLHVGAGTFLPVSVEDTRDHRMHAEWGEISTATAARLNAVHEGGGRIVSVGTTSLRLLESAATPDGTIESFCADTDIFITPGYRFRAVDAMITNFHLPRSTLFMLVCAFAGSDRMKAAYAHAIADNYRFYSYGDACYLERAREPEK